MCTKKNLYKGPGRVRNTFVLGVLLTFGGQMPFVNADEANTESVDALQFSMSRNQASFDQKMSGMQDGLLQESVFRAEMMLEKTAEFSMREVELAVDGSTDQQGEISLKYNGSTLRRHQRYDPRPSQSIPPWRRQVST